jgi:hypothetical protein
MGEDNYLVLIERESWELVLSCDYLNTGSQVSTNE